MKPQIGKKYLVTTSEWFYAPDGEMYKSVHGTINGVFSDEATLGVKSNSRSTNWYLSIGKMLVAGCQIHYAVQCDKVNPEPCFVEIIHEDKIFYHRAKVSRIYITD